MNKKQILKKAIEKAEKNGYKGFAKMLPAFIAGGKKRAKRVIMVIMKARANDIIFSHDFAKAFFGKGKEVCTYCGIESGKCKCKSPDECCCFRYIKDWQYHLQQLVLNKDPIKYLEKFL